LIPRKIVVVAEPFPPRLGADRVASALAGALRRAGHETESFTRDDRGVALLEPSATGSSLQPSAPALMQARALVLADAELCNGCPPNGSIFEIATRARQGGVPAYAVTGVKTPDLFQARMLDLQVVLFAHDERGLTAAGNRLGELV
jgi:hypothetical protein